MYNIPTDARFFWVKINRPGPVSAVGKVGDIVWILKYPTQGTLILNNTIIRHYLVNFIKMIIFWFGYERKVQLRQIRGHIGDPRLVQFVSLSSCYSVMCHVHISICVIDKVQVEPGWHVVLLNYFSIFKPWAKLWHYWRRQTHNLRHYVGTVWQTEAPRHDRISISFCCTPGHVDIFWGAFVINNILVGKWKHTLIALHSVATLMLTQDIRCLITLVSRLLKRNLI